MTPSPAQSSPNLIARLAGALYVLSVASAVFSEFFSHHSLGLAAVLLPVFCYVAVTLLLYRLFKPVQRTLAALALSVGLVGLLFEAIQWQPRSIDIAVVFHGLYCLLIGALIFKSTFLPRFLGVFIAIAGVVWLLFISPQLANAIAPYNTVAGLVGEAAPMLWLLIRGCKTKEVSAQR